MADDGSPLAGTVTYPTQQEPEEEWTVQIRSIPDARRTNTRVPYIMRLKTIRRLITDLDGPKDAEEKRWSTMLGSMVTSNRWRRTNLRNAARWQRLWQGIATHQVDINQAFHQVPITG